MRLLKIAAVLVLSFSCALAQTTSPKPQTHPAPITPPASTATSPSAKIPGFDINALDRTMDPCVDFYRFACGAWMANNPIPPDQSRWGRFDDLQQRNRELLRDILEGAAAPNPKRTANEQKIGDFYASCMDEAAINAAGAKPIEPDLKRVATITDRTTLIDTVADLYARGMTALLSFDSSPDMHDARMMVADVDQGGISLPDRDYYLKQDAKSAETRAKFVEHVQKMFELLGDRPDAAAAAAKTVMNIETELAKGSMDRTSRRDPKNRDHKMSTQELLALGPNFDFPRFFTGVRAPAFQTLNVTNPEFVKQVSAQLAAIPLADWKTYLRWRVLRANASMLAQPFVDETFRFNGLYLGGQKELEPRWKRCVRATDRALGEALGQLYVERTFGADGKQRMLRMVEALEAAMGTDIRALPWMTDATKKQAQGKLSAIANNIGYPDKWRDYSKLQIVRGDATGNLIRANAFETAREINKIGKPVDRKEWRMSPPTVNAYYRSAMNDINFPAGILQPPFFDKTVDDAVNFGGIGAVIGHELTHGFDDSGAKFDAVGNLHDWWTPEDFREFNKRTECLVQEYGNFVAVDDVHLNGKLTLGENTADNGGVRIAHMALQNTLAGKQVAPIDGFTPDQRFFLGYAQIWCQNTTPETSRLRALTDPHSPGPNRVNGVVVNMPEFQKAFNCKTGQPMVSANACRVW